MENAVGALEIVLFTLLTSVSVSEWDAEEPMLLTHSWGRCDRATDAGSALLLFMRWQHSPR